MAISTRPAGGQDAICAWWDFPRHIAEDVEHHHQLQVRSGPSAWSLDDLTWRIPVRLMAARAAEFDLSIGLADLSQDRRCALKLPVPVNELAVSPHHGGTRGNGGN